MQKQIRAVSEGIIELPPALKQQTAVPIEPVAKIQNISKTDTTKSNFTNFYNAQKHYDIVAACLILEAGGEGKVGMEAVNEVLHNRALAKYGNDNIISLSKVATQPYQFSCFNAGIDTAIARAKRHPKWDEALAIMGASTTQHTRGSKYYHTVQLLKQTQIPGWIKKFKHNKVPFVKIGNHIFYYGPRAK